MFEQKHKKGLLDQIKISKSSTFGKERMGEQNPPLAYISQKLILRNILPLYNHHI